MLKWYVIIAAGALVIIGLIGFTVARLPNFVQFDLLQSFIYLTLGVVGLKLGLVDNTNTARARYARVTGGVGFILLAVGLTIPNLFDVVHLEVPEHFFHLTLGLVGSFIGEHYRRS